MLAKINNYTHFTSSLTVEACNLIWQSSKRDREIVEMDHFHSGVSEANNLAKIVTDLVRMLFKEFS